MPQLIFGFSGADKVILPFSNYLIAFVGSQLVAFGFILLFEDFEIDVKLGCQLLVDPAAVLAFDRVFYHQDSCFLENGLFYYVVF